MRFLLFIFSLFLIVSLALYFILPYLLAFSRKAEKAHTKIEKKLKL